VQRRSGHGLQLTGFLAVLAAAVSLVAAFPAGAETPLELALLDQINAVRAAHGLAPLRLNAGLQAAADEHSQEMARDGYFAHESANGSSFWQRVRQYYATRTARSWSAGENILWASPRIGPKRAITVWMNSPPHRENLLSPRWREIGVDALHVRAPGIYGGRWVTIVTADFGVRH
jgi:uncharacterized protein YkwD